MGEILWWPSLIGSENSCTLAIHAEDTNMHGRAEHLSWSTSGTRQSRLSLT